MSTTHTAKADYLSTEALAQRWACTAGHLANLRSEGRGLPFVRIGSAVRYPLSEVEAAERGERPEILTVHAPIRGAA